MLLMQYQKFILNHCGGGGGSGGGGGVFGAGIRQHQFLLFRISKEF